MKSASLSPAPVTTGFEGADLNRLFSHLLKTTVGVALIYSAVSMLTIGVWAMVLGPLLIAAAGLACLRLQRAGRQYFAMSLFIWAVWCVVALQSAVRGGGLNPILNVNVVLVLLAGWLVGMRQAVWVCVMSAAWLVVLTGVQVFAWWHPSAVQGAWQLLVAQLGVLIGGFLAFRLVLKAYQGHVDKIQALNQALAEKVQALSDQGHAMLLSERRVRQILQASPLPITVAEFDSGVCLEVNPAWERAFQRQRGDVLGKTPVELGFWKDEAHRETFKQRFAGTQRLSGLEVTFHLPDGVERTFDLSSERFKYGELDCVMTISMDVTERKHLQLQLQELNATLEQRVMERTSALDDANRNLRATMGSLQRAQDELIGVEKLASLGSLVAGVAHELNTPLGNALITASALQEMTASATEEAAAGTMKKSTFMRLLQNLHDGAQLTRKSLERAAELISSFKQVAVDQESERRREFDVQQTVHEIIETLKPSFKHEEVRILLDLPEGLVMDSFPGPLGQVVINLVSNAQIHGLNGRNDGRITLRAVGSDDGKTLTLTVSDNGRGIAPEHLGQVFDPFFTTRLGQGGSGLGLAVSHRIVTRILGGRIKVSSVPGEGAVFEITLPRVAPQVVN
ncbi:ATP-binding protein [Rhodoferax sp.]|uniref:ATP-binding protein n=1 Tax=Rhodoferax sp. TaxID=50421 RepID=UPI0025D37414|nr:ATP-binding protein [Rhodoferax sp.]